jgi:hypothetical protein
VKTVIPATVDSPPNNLGTLPTIPSGIPSISIILLRSHFPSLFKTRVSTGKLVQGITLERKQGVQRAAWEMKDDMSSTHSKVVNWDKDKLWNRSFEHIDHIDVGFEAAVPQKASEDSSLKYLEKVIGSDDLFVVLQLGQKISRRI